MAAMMETTKTESARSTKHDEATSDEDILARRKAARRALFERVANQPTMNLGNWNRDEAYEG